MSSSSRHCGGWSPSPKRRSGDYQRSIGSGRNGWRAAWPASPLARNAWNPRYGSSVTTAWTADRSMRLRRSPWLTSTRSALRNVSVTWSSDRRSRWCSVINVCSRSISVIPNSSACRAARSGRRREVVEGARGPDAQIVGRPGECREVWDRGPKQQLVVIDAAVYVVTVGGQVVAQRIAMPIQHGIDDRMRGNDFHVHG